MEKAIKYNEYKALSGEHRHRRPVLVSVKLCEEDDPIGYPDFLETELDEANQTVISSCRYTDSCIAQFGWEKVRGWVEEDRKELEQFGKSWWYVGVLAKAEIVIPSSDGKCFHKQTIDTPGIWGINSECADCIKEEGQAELSDLQHLLATLNVVIPETFNGFLEGDF